MVEFVAIGTLNQATVHPRETFQRAIAEGSAAILIAHIHPPQVPSPTDRALQRHFHTADRVTPLLSGVWTGSAGLLCISDTIKDLEQRGTHFKSLQEQLDTATSGGKLVFHVCGTLAEFERNLIRERARAGLALDF